MGVLRCTWALASVPWASLDSRVDLFLFEFLLMFLAGHLEKFSFICILIFSAYLEFILSVGLLILCFAYLERSLYQCLCF